MSEFKREPRYIVFKIKDILGVLTGDEQRELQRLGNKIAKGRARAGKAPFNAVVVEQDWPEFEPTWEAIETRMKQQV
jgi:hypothetical protein